MPAGWDVTNMPGAHSGLRSCSLGSNLTQRSEAGMHTGQRKYERKMVPTTSPPGTHPPADACAAGAAPPARAPGRGPPAAPAPGPACRCEAKQAKQHVIARRSKPCRAAAAFPQHSQSAGPALGPAVGALLCNQQQGVTAAHSVPTRRTTTTRLTQSPPALGGAAPAGTAPTPIAAETQGDEREQARRFDTSRQVRQSQLQYHCSSAD